MRDSISLDRATKLHPSIKVEVISLIDEVESGMPDNMKIRIVQGLRTIDEQNALYAIGRTKPGHIVTNAMGGSSYHNYGLAIDFAIMYDKDSNGTFETLSWDLSYDGDKDNVSDWHEVVKVFKAAGFEWGGDWKTLKDYPHLQKSFGNTWKQLYAKYGEQRFIAGSEYVIV